MRRNSQTDSGSNGAASSNKQFERQWLTTGGWLKDNGNREADVPVGGYSMLVESRYL